jgi:hypothetical protein
MLFHGSGRNTKGQEIAVMISQDRGETWTEPIRVAKALPGFVSDPDDGFPLRTGDIIPEIAAGPNGSVYMVWQEATLAPSGSAIAFSKSLDGGLTWSEPVRINSRPDVQAFTPSVEVLPDGTIAVTHYDLRNNTPDPATLPTDYWFLHSHDGGTTWTETRVTPTSFDHELAPIARGYFLGDTWVWRCAPVASWQPSPRQRPPIPPASSCDDSSRRQGHLRIEPWGGGSPPSVPRRTRRASRVDGHGVLHPHRLPAVGGRRRSD